MYIKYSIILFLWLTSVGMTLRAQDSLSVWKIEYEYKRFSADTINEQDALFHDMATYGRVTLYYSDSVYRIQYADDYWQIGDFNTSRRYTIHQHIASEGLSAAQQIPDLYNLPDDDFPAVLWAKDYRVQRKQVHANILGRRCDVLVFQPSQEGVDVIYEVFVSAQLPIIPWYPYSFMSRLPAGFLGMRKTNAARNEVVGFKATEIDRITVPAGFFEVPEGMEIEPMLAPPIGG